MAANYKSNLHCEILPPESMKLIHEKSLELLERIGIKIADTETSAALCRRGAKIKSDDGYLQLPRELVQEALHRTPKKLVLYDRDGNENIVVEEGNRFKYFGSMSDGLVFEDPFTREIRPYTIKDSTLMLKLCDALDSVRFILSTGIFHGSRTDVYTELFLYKTMTESSKTVMLGSNDVPSFKNSVEMVQIVAGGAEAFRKKPFAFALIDPIPPLIFPAETTARIRLAAEAGIPIISMPYSMMGGTAPMSHTMALIQSNAEILAGLVLAQHYNPDINYIYASMPTILDMQTTIGSYAAPEFHLNIAAAADMAHYYGLPFFGTAGVSDARSMDEQACCETTMEIMSSFLGNSDIIHDLGFLDHANVNSPRYLVLSDELIQIVNAYTKGIDVENEVVDLDVIERNKATGHYLNDDHTMENFNQVRYSKLFTRKMENPDKFEVEGKIIEKISDILENHRAKPLPAEIRAALDQFIEQFHLDEELSQS